MGGKEAAMLELTDQQAQALEAQKSPLRLVNPRSREVFASTSWRAALSVAAQAKSGTTRPTTI
jgi:hypothetical protein